MFNPAFGMPWSAMDLLAGVGHCHRVRTMCRGRRGAFRSDREVIKSAFGGVAARERRVVGHIGTGPAHTRCHALHDDGPFRFARDSGDSTEAFAGISAGVSSSRTAMRAMRGRIALGSTGVIRTTPERISGRIGFFARRNCGSRRHAAFLARLLRIRARAVGHDVRAVFLGQSHHAAAARTAHTAARRATRRGFATSAARIGTAVGLGFVATDRRKRS
jgi:hypothetical protein